MATDPTLPTPVLPLAAIPNPCEDAQSLAAKAERCRRLAAGISDRHTAEVLRDMALQYEAAAQRLGRGD